MILLFGFHPFSRSPGTSTQQTDCDGPDQQPDIAAVGQTGKTRNCARVQGGNTIGGRRMLATGTKCLTFLYVDSVGSYIIITKAEGS